MSFYNKESSDTERLEGAITETIDTLPQIIASLKEDDRILYIKKLEEIKNRYQDPEFRLAVLGNFSCGKSTFLNALIGQELLSVSDLPTTAIPTYIRWNKYALLQESGIKQSTKRAEDPVIKLTMHSGKDYILEGDGVRKFQQSTGIRLPDDMGERIDYITTTNSLIGKIAKIDISFPERTGFENFCLIDTPGMNPGDEASKEHILQTQSVLCNEADAAIVLYTAKDAMSKDTRQFMEENAIHLMDNAIVVLTKMDLVPKKQIDKLIRNTIRLVREQYHQQEPSVYSISASEALEYQCGRSQTEEVRLWAENFNRAIYEIMQQLHKRRSGIISRRAASLITGMMDVMLKAIEEETDSLEREKEWIAKASIRNLEDDVNTLYMKYEKSMKSTSVERLSKASQIVREQIKEKRDAILERIHQATNQKELNKCLKEYYPDMMSGINQAVIQKINTEIIPEINKGNRNYIKQVEECLEKYRRYLGKMNSRSISVKSGMISGTSLNMDSGDTTSFLGEHATLILAAGISMMIPGLNLLVLAAGFFWDSVRFESRKSEAEQDVQGKCKDFETQLMGACEQSMIQTEQQNMEWAKRLLNDYKKKYRTSFDQIEQNYHRNKRIVEEKIRRNREYITIMGVLKGKLS